MDSTGHVYGTVPFGGPFNESMGIAFELTPRTGAAWTETIVYSFLNNSPNGASPYCGLTFDSSGNLYGTTLYGGTYGGGIVFEIVP